MDAEELTCSSRSPRKNPTPRKRTHQCLEPTNAKSPDHASVAKKPRHVSPDSTTCSHSRSTSKKTPQKTPVRSTPKSLKRTPKRTPRRSPLTKSPSTPRRHVKRILYKSPDAKKASSPVVSPWPVIDTPTKNAHLERLHGKVQKGKVYSPQLGDDLQLSPVGNSSGNVDADEDADDGIQPLSIVSSDDEDDIDEILDRKSQSQSIKLTATNVRNIIREVITNEAVNDMVRNTLHEGALGEQLKEAIFEPKMTRSRVKRVLQGDANASPWSLIPIKSLQSVEEEEPKFMDIAFPDDEEEDEYEPTIEDLQHGSDDESALSSHASDVDSPLPQLCTPVTPEPSSPLSAASGRMDPPLAIPSRNVCRSLSMSEEQTDATIARRTRSKLPLTDIPLEHFESEFVAPDIPPDVYDSSQDDFEWLNLLFADPTKTEPLEEEMEDPEYVAQETEEEEEEDEECRTDKAVRIPQKEVDELVKELLGPYESGDLINSDEDQPSYNSNVEQIATELQQSAPVRVPPIDLGPQLAQVMADTIKRIKSPETQRPETVKFTAEESLQLQDQMRKHVQQLAQSYVQAFGSTVPKNDDDTVDWQNPLLIKIREHAHNKLIDLRERKDEKQLGSNSAFYTPNLESAIAITGHTYHSSNQYFARETARMMKKIKSAGFYDSDGLSFEQMKVFISDRTFIFPQLIPEVTFNPEYCANGSRPGQGRNFFMPSEDALLALGLEQFKDTKPHYALIRELLLPNRKGSKHDIGSTIRFRVKNIRDSKTTDPSNVLVHYLKYGQLPELPRYTDVEPETAIVAPVDRAPELLPQWWNAFALIACDHPMAVLGRSHWEINFELDYRLTEVRPKIKEVKEIPLRNSPPPLLATAGEGVYVLTSTQLQSLGINVVSIVSSAPSSQITTVTAATPGLLPAAQMAAPPSLPILAPGMSSAMSLASDPLVPCVADQVTVSVNSVPCLSGIPSDLSVSGVTSQVTIPLNQAPIPSVACQVTIPSDPSVSGVASQVTIPSDPSVPSVADQVTISTDPMATGHDQVTSTAQTPEHQILSLSQEIESQKIISQAFEEAMSSPASPLSSPLKTPTKIFRSIAPKPGNYSIFLPSPIKTSPKKHKRHRILQQKARKIAPKALISRPYDSPVKKAAKKAVKRSIGMKSPCKSPLRRIVPKPVVEDDKEEEDKLAQLMEASTSIRSAPLKEQHKRTTGRPCKDKEPIADMLQPNLLQSDPLADERDTHFAMSYMHLAKESLSPDEYYQFLQALYDFGHSESKDPVQLYTQLSEVLSEHDGLIKQFAGFLLPHQAKECGVLDQCLQLQHIKLFIRKLEVGLKKHPVLLQKIIREVVKNKSLNQNKDTIKSLLKSHEHLLEEFLAMFPEEQPTPCATEDFETVCLGASDEEVDDFECVELPESDDEAGEGTKDCVCKCHESSDASLSKRKRHCQTCGLKFSKGMVYLQSVPVTVVLGHDQKEEADGEETGAVTLTADSLDAARPGSAPKEVNGPTDFSTALKQVIDTSEDNHCESDNEHEMKHAGPEQKEESVCDSTMSSSASEDDGAIMFEGALWTVEDDRTILETCKAHGVKPTSFASIAQVRSKTVEQIRKRFDYLRQLYAEIGSESEDGC